MGFTGTLFALDGRLPRAPWWIGTTGVLAAFMGVFHALNGIDTWAVALAVYPVVYWALLALAIKRCHDFGSGGGHLALALIPFLGLIWLVIELGFRRGTAGENRFGPEPDYDGLDHHRVAMPPHRPGEPQLVNDVTQLNPTRVAAIVVPASVPEVQEALRRSSGPVSIGGGHFSMGGQVGSPDSIHLDMRRLNRVLTLSPADRRIRVEAGIRWCEVQRAIDAFGLSVKIMQTYANFTVGGSLSVNCHGRYVGLGAVILSVRAIALVLADGRLVEATPTENEALFYGAIGGYGGLGVIVEVELDLAENKRLERTTRTLPTSSYLEHFRQNVRMQPKAVLHNADLYPPHFRRARAVTWSETDAHVTQPRRLMRAEPSHRLYRYLFWAASETPLGNWRREWIYEPLFYLGRAVHWRNYESGYDVAELEPATRRWKTYVLQEYFIPFERFDEFVPKMAAIFQRFGVNVVNVSVRHAVADPGSVLAWASCEMFAFVVYYKQGVDDAAKNVVATWTRELIEAALDCGGRYYLPYQAHATAEQFHRAYPRAREFFALKRATDPDFRFRNVLWDTYYAPPEDASAVPSVSQFHAVFDDVVWRDRFFLFLQSVYHIVPEDRFHQLIIEATRKFGDDEAIYRYVQGELPRITPKLSPLTYAIPALMKQKREMTRQTLEILGATRAGEALAGGGRAPSLRFDGVLEIGSTGRYLSVLRKHVTFTGPIFVMNEAPPTNAPPDVIERGQLRKLGEFLPLDYAPIPSTRVADASLDLVTCYVGLHHATDDQLGPFVASIVRVLRSGGLFILRDHDTQSDAMTTFVSLVHTVFNVGLAVPWAVDRAEVRRFRPVATWVALLAEQGLVDLGPRLLQAHDPSANTLMAFRKR